MEQQQKKKQVDIPATHLWIYKRVKEKHGIRIVRNLDVVETIRRTVRQIPKRFGYIVLDEMCDYGLIEKIDRLKCRVLNNDCDEKLKMIEDYYFIR